jgi:multiple sugar transport system substrate-binding protein
MQDDTEQSRTPQSITRRDMLRRLSLGVAGVLLTACGAPQASTPSADNAGSAAATTSSAPAATSATVAATSAPAAQGQPVEIVFHARTGAGGEHFQMEADRFHQAQDRVRVRLDLTPSQEYDQKLTTLLAGNQLGDGFFNTVFGTFYPFAARGVMADMRPLAEAAEIDLNSFFPASLEQASWDGTIYGIPQGTHAGWTVMYVNQDAWEAAGAANPAWEWTYQGEWLEAVQAATVAGNASTPRFGFSYEMTQGLLAQSAYTFIRSWGGDWLDPNNRSTSTLLSEPSVAALTFMHDLIHEYGVSASPETYADEPFGSFFSSGLTASWGNGVWARGQLDKTISNQFQWQAYPMPAGPGGRGSFLGNDTLCVNAASPNKEALMEWYKWLTSAQVAAEQVNFGISTPALIAAYDMEPMSTDQTIMTARRWMEVATPSTLPANARVAEFRNAVAQGLQAFLLETNDPQAALTELNAAVQDVLDKPIA